MAATLFESIFGGKNASQTAILGNVGLAGAGLGVVGGVLGMMEAQRAADAAQHLLEEARLRIQNLPVPDLTKEIIYQQFKVVGDYSPERLNKTIEEYAPLALIRENPENKLRQQEVYSQVQDLAQTGLGAQDKLALEQSRRRATQDVLSQMASIKAQAKERGQFGGGQELAMQALAAQSAADRQAMEGAQIAANAASNRQNQLQNLYNMASGMRASDLGVEQQNVQAKNLRDELMMKYSTGRELQNKSWAQEQQRLRVQAEQAAANQNVQTSQQEAYRRGYLAPMEMFKMNRDKEGMITNLMGQQANLKMGLGQSKSQAFSDIAGGIGTSLLGGAGAFKRY